MPLALATCARLRCVLRAFAIIAAIAFSAVFARAEDDKAALTRARATFQQAIELEQAGNWSAAVRRFREVGQVRMTPQVRFHIALCEDRLGKLVAALGGYELALADADSVGPEFRAEVEANVTRLRERIPRLVIARGAGADAAVISLDDVSIGESSVGVEMPVDPGPHAVTARAPGYLPFELTVTLAEGEHKTLEVVLEPAPRDVVASSAQRPSRPAALSSTSTPLVPYIVGGAGVVSLVTSGVLFALRQSTASSLEESCEGGVCPTSERGEYSRLKTYHYASFVTLGAGVAAVGTGVALLVLDRPRENRREQSRLRVTPLVSNGAGATLHVKF